MRPANATSVTFQLIRVEKEGFRRLEIVSEVRNSERSRRCVSGIVLRTPVGRSAWQS